jgi:hypothetical protein
MQLIQILLPRYSNSGKPFPFSHYQKVKHELTQRFKGLTAYNRSPAEGRWVKGATTKRDEILVYEVMSASKDVRWWKKFRNRLEKQFHQESIVIRSQKIRLL